VGLSAALTLVDVIAIGAVYALVALSTGGGVQGRLGQALAAVGLSGDRGLATLAVIVSVVYLLKVVAALWLKRWTLRVLLDAETSLQSSVLRLSLQAPLSYHLRTNSASSVQDLTRTIPEAISRGLNTQSVVVTDAFLLVSLFATTVLLQPVPVLFGTLYFVAMGFLILRVIKPRQARSGRQDASAGSAAFKTLNHAFGAIKEILVADRSDAFLRSFIRSRHEMVSATTAAIFYGEAPRMILEAGTVIAVAPVIALVVTTSGANAAAGIVLFAAVALRALPTVSRLLASVGSLARARVCALRILDTRHDLQAAVARHRMPQRSAPAALLRRSVVFDRVSFRYPADDDGDRPVLSDLSLEIEAGEYLGLVGESGGGKSTFLDLLVGLQIPTSGTIHVDGMDLRTVSDEWHRVIGYVPQHTCILDCTVGENVAFGHVEDDIDRERVWEALRLAHLEHVVADLPAGLDTPLGERGVRISGGQQQRIGLARALYRRPRLLVLDEATSALDAALERRILHEVKRLACEITTVAVTHRLAALDQCDRILVLANGALQPYGSMRDSSQERPA
jgi:ABC-type multidrug transport system fused ATPase/permease subunit